MLYCLCPLQSPLVGFCQYNSLCGSPVNLTGINSFRQVTLVDPFEISSSLLWASDGSQKPSGAKIKVSAGPYSSRGL